MKVCLYVVVDEENDSLVEKVQREICELVPSFSFSPARQQPSLAHCYEFYATTKLGKEEISLLLEQLNNDWDQEEDVYSAYGFNTTMFDSHVYYLQLSIQ